MRSFIIGANYISWLLYSVCVSQRSTGYKRKSIDYFDQQNCLPEFKECWIEYKHFASHALWATVKRMDFAFEPFLKIKSGYPRFESSRHYKGLTYPCKAGWKACTKGKSGSGGQLGALKRQKLVPNL